MVRDKMVESNHRKHSRSYSPSEEVVKSSKRQKHHHHKHHHDHKHRHSHHLDEENDFMSLGDGGELEMEEGEILKRGSIDRDSNRDHYRGSRRSRDKARSSSRETGRENEKERRREKDRDRGRRELQSDPEKHKSLDEVRHKHSIHDTEDDLEIRSSDSLKSHNPNGGNFKETRGNFERSETDKASSRETGRENERERRKDQDRDRRRRELQSDQEKYKTGGYGYGEVRHDAEDDLDSVKGHKPNGCSVKETQGNVENSEIDNDDDGEDVVWEVEEQEAVDLNRIEESRRITQAILEKYKKKLEQSSTVAELQAKVGLDTEAIDGEVAKLSSKVGEPPARLVISDLDRTLASTEVEEGSPKSDMFSDDIFGESPAAGTRKGNGLVPFVRSGLNDNWDDAEGYYSYQFGELLDDRYEIMATHGKGVFSTVVRAKDTKPEVDEPEEVAIKIIRNNETMHKAGQAEIRILKKLAGSDPENKRHCVRLLSTFKYRNHLCLVFESLHLNLREVVKKIGVNIGLKLSDVRVYAEQLFISLKHLKNCGVLHCDIKPDNILVNEGRNMLKLCDFGSAMFAGENQVTPYLVSRFYRAPEIILGLSYDHPLDIWSVGCCLYELYSGKIMFPGSTNNDMLRLHMELKGPFPKKMLRKGAFIDQHFDKDLCFYATEEDSVTRKTVRRIMVNIKPKDLGSVIRRRYEDEDPKVLVHFRNLLDKIFTLDPQKRLTVSQALAHPFITGK
ncbi:Protein kinase domain [Arabidopsis suecica]|uniref:Serine/threonine-protein kinase PRP4 homolog n=1 Tax=Arabidopsis suecica TaxID=45249 RepID=A0A8T1ZXX1_ARASU|nr:Protein kinase domain [Arabidopsis suecica]